MEQPENVNFLNVGQDFAFKTKNILADAWQTAVPL